MITGLKISRFRGITECEIAGFKNINILVGRNNQGKSSILEALYLATAAFRGIDPFQREENKIVYLLNRRSNRQLRWETGRQILWRGYDTDQPIEIEIQYGERKDLQASRERAANLKIEFVESHRNPFISIPRTSFSEDKFEAYFGQMRGRPPDFVRLAFKESILYLKDQAINPGKDAIHQLLEEAFPNFPQIDAYMEGMMFIDANLMHDMEKVEKALWPNLLRERGDKLVTNVLREGYQVGIEDLTYMPMANVYQLAAKLSKTTVRVDDLGDGARYSTIWIMVAAIARNTAILIEEPESHQHPGGLVKSLEALLDLAKRNNVQIFATTHSLEFIKFVEKIAEERKLDMSTFFIEMDEKGRIESRTITSEDSQYLTKMGLDIRFLDVV